MHRLTKDQQLVTLKTERDRYRRVIEDTLNITLSSGTLTYRDSHSITQMCREVLAWAAKLRSIS